MTYLQALRKFQREYLKETLLKHKGNQSVAAVEAGIHRNTYSRIMAGCGLTMHSVRNEIKESQKRALLRNCGVRQYESHP